MTKPYLPFVRSESITSRAAARMTPDLRAEARAGSSIRPALAVLIKKAPEKRKKHIIDILHHFKFLLIIKRTNKSTFTHHLDSLRINHTPILFMQSAMQTNTITLIEQFL